MLDPNGSAKFWIVDGQLKWETSLIENGKLSFTVYDMQGRVIANEEEKDYTRGIQRFSKDIATWNSGFYIIRHTLNGQTFNTKLILN